MGASVSLLQPPTCLLPQSWEEDSEVLMSLFFFFARRAVPSTALQKICCFHPAVFFKHHSPLRGSC